MRLEWVINCSRCHKEHREKAKTHDIIFDSDPVKVKQLNPKGWESDGMGHWLCAECYKIWTLQQLPPKES